MSQREQKDIFAANLNRYMSENEKNQIDLAKDLNLSAQIVNNWVNAKSLPRMDKIEMLARYFGVSKSDLLDRPTDAKPAEVIRIPVLGKVAAGIPIEEIEDVIDWEEIPTKWTRGGKKFFALQLHGDSMEPRMYDGDVVIVQKQDDAESGDYVIAAVNGDHATCKRLMKYRDSIALLSLNSKYDPMIYTNEEVQTKPVTILGVVREIRGKMKAY